ncbi:hypothetical protein MMC25_007480 [Agyrium rufum]|nr:hypothetical protein [Agyrium rufum]
MPSGEISTTTLVADALSKGKRVFVPYLYREGSTSLMDMVRLASQEDYEGLERDKWGIPSVSAASVRQRERCIGENGDSDLADLDIIVVPGVAFDIGMRRLGHGKGYYDRFFSRYLAPQNVDMNNDSTHGSPLSSRKSTAWLVGLALNEQVLNHDNVPVTATDWRLNAIVTGDGRILR